MIAPPLPDDPERVPEEGTYRGDSLVRVWAVTAWRCAIRNRHATIPLSAPLALTAAGAALHAQHAADPALWGGIAVTVITWFNAPRKWDRPSEVLYARLSAAAGSAWLIAAARWGITQPVETALAPLALAWGGPFWWHKRPHGWLRRRRDERRHDAEVAWWNAWWQSHAVAWGVGGSHVVDIEEREAMVSLLIQLQRGRQTFADIRQILPRIESGLDGYVAHRMTRAEINRGNPSQVWLHLKVAEPLRETIEWQPSMAVTDIRQKAVIAARETGGHLTVGLRASWFILGRTRSGKSNELSVLLASTTGCRNARTLLIDRKGGRAARPWLAAVDWVATTIEEARLVLGMAVAEIGARGAYAYNGTEQLEPTEDCPTLFVVIDETHNVTSEISGDSQCASLLARIAGEGQGLEVYAVVLTQYGALAESVRTEQTRGNLNRRCCFQTEHASHGQFALGDDTDVDTTKITVKGGFYYRADSATSPEMMRAPHVPHELAASIAAANAERTQIAARPLRLYATAWQQVYDERWDRVPEFIRAHAPQAQILAARSPGEATAPSANKIINSPGVIVSSEENDEIAAINADAAELSVTEADVAAAAALRAADGRPPVDLPTELARRIHAFAAALQAAPGHGGATPAELKRASGLGRTWIHQHLAALTASGAVSRATAGSSRYLPAQGADILAELEKIRREGDQLASAAREMTG